MKRKHKKQRAIAIIWIIMAVVFIGAGPVYYLMAALDTPVKPKATPSPITTASPTPKPTAEPTPEPTPEETPMEAKASDFVNIKDIDDSIIVDLKYATDDNFTGEVVYESDECLLRRGTAEKLKAANELCKKDGYTIKIYDGYRSLSAQEKFWELVPDRRYVAPPDKGSRHNRGASVDVTLVDGCGNELEMPSAFDDFSERASRKYKGSSEEAQANMEYLTKVMTDSGFTTISTEWWHYDDGDWEDYPIE